MFKCYFVRCGLSSNIFLVFMISFTCVQTKEIKNSSIFQQNADTSNGLLDKLNQNYASDDTNNSINLTRKSLNHIKITHPIDNPIKIQFENSSIEANAPVFENKLNINDSNSLNVSSNDLEPLLHAPITFNHRSYVDYDDNDDDIDETNIRNGKDLINRAALRIAARQGLEAMHELYEKQEPHLLNKGSHIKNFNW